MRNKVHFLPDIGLKTYLVAIIIALASVLGLFMATKPASAACAAPTTDYGTATQTINVTNAGTYHVWSRIMAPSSSSNTYLLEVDGGTCYTIGGSSSIAANTWTWVDYQNGTSSSKVDVNLTAGNHTFKLIGNAGGVKLDRLILLTDNGNCTVSSGATPMPTGTGDNCLVAPPPNNPPTVDTLTASPTTVTQGQVVNLSATATDNAGSNITKVDFYDGSTLLGTDTTGQPFTLSWNTDTSTTTGSHSITAKATDALSLTSPASTPVTVTVNAAPPADTTPPTVSITSPTNGATVSGSAVKIDATAGDNVGVTKVEFYDGTKLLGTDTTSPYSYTWDTTSITAPNESHNIIARAYDAAGLNASFSVNVIVNNAPPADTTPPTVSLTSPASGAKVSGNSVTLAATASDNVHVDSVTFSVDGVTVGSPDTSPDATGHYSVIWDSTTAKNGSHTIMAKATDSSQLTASSQYSVTVCNVDCEAPTAPTNLSGSAAAYNKVNLSWTAATDNVGVAGYTIVRSTATDNTTFQTSGTATTFSDTTAQADTSYSYYVFARDAYGNQSLNSNLAFVTTPKIVDTQAPKWPPAGAQLTATAVSDTQINLSWNAATDNVGVKNYRIFRNDFTPGKFITVSTTTSFGDTGLKPNTTYTYKIRAVDASDNPSNFSNLATSTTMAVPPPPVQNGNLAGNVTVTNSSNPYSCPTQPTLSKTTSKSSDLAVVDCVKRVQWFLNLENAAGLTVDGWFGSNTDIAVRNFQTRFGLTADGTVGPTTWSALESRGSTFAPGSGAQISYNTNGSQHTGTADNEGYYYLTDIVPGSYAFTYSLANYASQTATNTINSSQTTTYNVTLQHL